MSQQLLEQQYEALTDQLLLAARAADWNLCAHLLEERERLIPLKLLNNRLKVIQSDQAILTLLENEKNTIGKRISCLNRGYSLIDRYLSGSVMNGRRFMVEG